MAVFSVPVTIGVDEDAIARNIHKSVENQIVEKITKEVKTIMFTERGYIGETNEPLKRMVKDAVENTVMKYEDVIIKGAIDKLADRLARRKDVKDKLNEICGELKEA